MAGLTARDRRWIKAMLFCKKYCGCHQMYQRSFFIGGYQFPLCARCTGIAAGYMAALVLAPFIRVPWPFLFLAVPMAADGTIQLLTSYESTNVKRVITGFLFGFSVLSCVFRAIGMIFAHFL